jgi:glucose-6-phosphate-specific signal transduction histidine kinase
MVWMLLGPLAPQKGRFADPSFEGATRPRIYRVTQEALRNCLHRAGASVVTVGLARAVKSVTLQVEDNGQRVLRRFFSLGYKSMNPRFSPIVTAWVRSFALSFARIFLTYPLTVSSLMES